MFAFIRLFDSNQILEECISKHDMVFNCHKKNKENKNIKQYDQIQTSNHENKHQNALKLFGSM